MTDLHLGVVMVAQNDEETVERTLLSFYEHVDAIVVSTDPRKGWTGKPITPDSTLDFVRRIDREHKIDIIEADFFYYDDPLMNDTRQRQLSADWLANKHPNLDWVLQIDADEEFLDFSVVTDYLANLPKRCRGVSWQMAQVFNILEDGRVLVVVDERGELQLYTFYLAHRPFAKLVRGRNPALHPFSLNRQTLRLNEVLRRSNRITGIDPAFDGSRNPSGLCLHHTFAKSEKRIQEKLKTWTHAYDFDTDQFFDLWKRSKTDWENIKNFHPMSGNLWPALKAVDPDELRNSVEAAAAA